MVTATVRTPLAWRRGPSRSIIYAKSLTVFLISLLAATLALSTTASAVKLRTLYSFCALPLCADGDNPLSGLLMDTAGNLYGITEKGGANALNRGDGGGAIFELVRPADPRKKWKFKVLYSFCAKEACADGADSAGDLIMDASGNLYGTTRYGGVGSGTAFELLRGAHKWKLKTLHKFCATNCGKAEGVEPVAGLTYQGASAGALYDGTSPLYGTASSGGMNSSGTVFELSPVIGTGRWKETTIHDFCSLESCADGSEPLDALTMDAAGNLYGTTFADGLDNGGTVFKLSGGSTHKRWPIDVVYTFCSVNPCADGGNSYAPVTFGPNGTLYGTVTSGGSEGIFALTSGGVESSVYRLCILGNCADGELPVAAVTIDAGGNFYTTTHLGGANSAGTFIKVSPSGVREALYSFCAKTGCTDGSNPAAKVTLDGSGAAFGTTNFGGPYGDDRGNGGTVFEILP
jgi:uncharacterized repeat protein (TIGR03803 family)